MPPPNPPSDPPIPSSILILGAGVFGLSTALSLSHHPSFRSTRLTLVDRFATPHAATSSVDSSRLVRADYADPAYAALGAAANAFWKGSEWGADGRYRQSGLCLLAEKGGGRGEGYVRGSLENVTRGKREREREREGEGVRVLDGREEVRRFYEGSLGGDVGEWGYVNWESGWVDAEKVMRWARKRVEDEGRVECLTGEVTELLYTGDGARMLGAKLASGEEVRAELTVVAMGAWSGRVVDLRGRASATGQILAYVDLNEEQQRKFANVPVPLNLTRGMFVVPSSQGHLKIARHGFGYANPVRIPHPDPRKRRQADGITVSLPRTTIEDPGFWAPREAEQACRETLRRMVPELAERPFSKTRLCWYCDTPKGDYLITYHPDFEGLFLATGGSGHGFKMLPVLGDKIVDCVLRQPPEEFKHKWCWSDSQPEDFLWTDDASRGGPQGMILDAEMKKGSKL